MLVVEYLDEQLSERTADDERKQPDQNQCFDDFWLAGADLVESVHALQLTKEQLDLPARLIELRDNRRAVLRSGEVRDVEVIAFVLVVPDADDTERLNGTAARAVVDAPFELDLTLDIDDVAVQLVQDVLDLGPFQGNGVTTPFP